MLIDELKVKISAEMSDLQRVLGSIKQNLSNLTKSAQNTENQINRMSKNGKAGMSAISRATDEAITKTKQLAQQVNETLSYYKKFGSSVSAIKDNTIEIKPETKRMEEALNQFMAWEKKIKSLQAELNEAKPKWDSGQMPEDQWNKISADLVEANSEAAKFANTYRAIRNELEAAVVKGDKGYLTPELVEARKELQKLKGDLANAKEKYQGALSIGGAADIDEARKNVVELSKQVEKAEYAYRKAKEAVEEFANAQGNKFSYGSEFSNMGAGFKQMFSGLAQGDWAQAVGAKMSGIWSKFRTDAAAAILAVNIQLQSGLRFTSFGQKVSQAFESVKQTVGNVASAVQQKIGPVGQIIGGAFQVGAASAKIALHGITGLLKTTLNVAIRLAPAFASVGKGLAIGLTKGVKAIAQMTTAIGGLMGKLNPLQGLSGKIGKVFTGLGNRIKNAFVFSVVYSSLNKLKSKIGEWLSTNEQMKGSLASLKSAWTTAFAPAVQAIIPVLQKICAWATSAANAFASLIALLTGKSVSTFKGTAEGMENAAKASDDMAASAGGAGAAAKEAQKEIAGFDELEVMSDNKDSGGGGGSAEVAETASELSDLFDIGKFDSWGAAFSALLDKLISKLPLLDSALQKVAEGLNWFSGNLLEAFTFPGVLEKVQTLATGLADCINHFMDAVDWDQLGQAIGAGFNLLINFITEFIYGIDWQGLGSHFAEGINGMLSRIDFTEVGKGLVAKFNVIWQTLLGFVTTLDWTQLGTKLKDGINGAIKNIDLAAASKTISEGVKGITKALTTMFDGIDVNQAKSKIKSFFDNLDIGGMINGLISTIESAFKVLWPIATTIWTELLNALTTGIKNTNWAEVGIMLGEMVNQLAADLPNIVQSLVDAIPALIEGILTALITFIGTVDIGGLVMGIMDGVAKIIAAIDVPSILQSIGLLIIELITQIPGLIAAALGGIADILGGLFEALGMDTIAGFFYGIGDALKDVVGWCKEHIVDPVVNAVKNLLGIHSPSTVFAEIGTNLVSGLLEGITKTWETITQFLTGAFTKMKTMFSQAWDNIKSTAKQKWDALKTNVTTTVSSIRDFAVERWENIRSEVESKTEQMKNAVKNKWEDMKTKVTEFTETIKTEVGKKWDEMKTNVSNLTETLRSTIQQKWEEMKTKVTEKTETLKKDINTKWENLKGDITEKTEVIRSTVQEKWNTMKSKVDEATGGLVSAAEAKFGEMKTNVTKVATDIHTAVKTDFENLKNDGDTSFSNMKTLVTGYFEQMKTTLLTDAGTIGQTLRQDVAGAADTIGSAFGTMWSKVSDIFGNLVDGIKDVARNVKNKAKEIWDDITKSNNAAADFDTDNGSGPGYRVPGMASGGVVTSPTLALVGEYSGAKSNPEIVTPESLLTSIVSKGNDDLIGVWLQTTRQIIQAIDNKDLDVAIGDTAIAQSVVRSNNSSIRRTGKPLLATI